MRADWNDSSWPEAGVQLPVGQISKSCPALIRKIFPAVKGGLEVVAERGGDAIIIANAAVVVSLDDCAPG